MKKAIVFAAAAVLAASACTKPQNLAFHRPDGKKEEDKPKEEELIGKSLPQWKAGELDIHAISTGRGECTFFILPDGTTMVVDAGDLYGYKNSSYGNVPGRPTEKSVPYQTQAQYMKYFLPSGRSSIDYFVLTHFHIDHMGHPTVGSRSIHPKGGYAICGVTGLYEELPFAKVIDRSYPAYNEVTTADNMDFYVKFVEYNVKNNGLVAEKFQVGTDRQIVEKHHDAAYPETKIFNWAASGVYWNGSTAVDAKMTAENALSCGFLLSYGKFDYWTSGDLNNNSVCQPVANAIGKKIEAMKCLHHMSNDSPYKVEVNVYNPQVVVTQSFYVRTEQPQQSIINAYSKSEDMFFTNIDDSLLNQYPDVYKTCKAINGHMVIRVAAGGESYMVYQLDDTDTSYKVKAVFGPYTCR